MSQSVLAELHAPELLAIREQHLLRLEALFAGERLEHPFLLNGIGGVSPLVPEDDPREWVTEALASLA